MALWQERAGRLSWQVLQESYVTVTRKLDPPRAGVDAREDVSALVNWRRSRWVSRPWTLLFTRAPASILALAPREAPAAAEEQEHH